MYTPWIQGLESDKRDTSRRTLWDPHLHADWGEERPEGCVGFHMMVMSLLNLSLSLPSPSFLSPPFLSLYLIFTVK